MNIEQVYLISDNLVATEDFYINVLRCNVLSKSDNFLAFQFGYTTLFFERSTEQSPFYHVAFDIPENQMKEALQWVKAKTNILPAEDDDELVSFPAWNAHSFYFYDNNGSVLEFICRHELNNRSDEPFKNSSILKISEVGIVTEDATALSKEITEKYGLQSYKLPIHPHFAAMGDAHGLLIIVKDTRNWFPTEKPAKRFRTKIMFRVAEKSYELRIE